MYKNILIPVVLGEGQSHDISFQAARQLADDDASFTILYVTEPIPGFVASEIPHEVLENTRREFENDLKTLAAGFPGSKPVMTHGHAGRAIVDYADANGIDCIVIASHKPGLQNWILGSTANRVIHHAKCSVHVIR